MKVNQIIPLVRTADEQVHSTPLEVTASKQCDQKKNCQMSIKVAQKWFLLEKLMILTPLQSLPKNVRYFGNLNVAKGFKKLPKLK